MSKGHISLDGRQFLIDPLRYQRSLANPFAAQLAQGQTYDDLQGWSPWVMDDWRAGVGQHDAQAGGYSYGELDSRFSGKLILPALTVPTDNLHTGVTLSISEIGDIEHTFSIGSGNTYTRVSKKIDFVETTRYIWVYLWAESGTVVRVSIYDDSSGTPTDTRLATGTFTASEERRGYYWYRAELTPATTHLQKHLVVEPESASGQITVPLSSTLSGSENENYRSKFYTGSAWEEYAPAPVRLNFISDVGTLGAPSTASSPVVGFYHNEDNMYLACGRHLFRRTTQANGYYRWLSIADSHTDPITDAIVFNNKIYLAFGNAQNFETYTESGFVAGSQNFDKFARWNNFLYGAYENDLYYSVDGTTWSGPYQVGPDDYTITGMAGFGSANKLGVATTDGLYVFNSNWVIGRKGWGGVDASNGLGMVEHDGDLFIPADGTLYRYTEAGNQTGGTFIDVWVRQDEDLPAERIGNIKALRSMNSYLVAFVDSINSNISSAWAYTGEGWHHLASFPEAMTASSLHYDRSDNRLWLGTGNGFAYHAIMPDVGRNPLRDSSYEYMPYGWIETPKFYGGLRELDKDLESVYVDGDNISTNRYLEIYWQDDESTAWELLGTITASGTELIWSDDNTRPNSKYIRIGVQAYTNDRSETPVVRAIRVKFHSNIEDRYAWAFPILLSKDQQMIDGEIRPQSTANDRAYITTLEKQVPPVDFVDLDGVEYRVKVQQASQTVAKYEWINDEALYESIHYLSVVEV